MSSTTSPVFWAANARGAIPAVGRLLTVPPSPASDLPRTCPAQPRRQPQRGDRYVLGLLIERAKVFPLEDR